MRIGIDIRVLEKKMTGVGRYLLNILKYIPECDDQNDYFLFSYGKLPQYEKGKIKNISTIGFTPPEILQKLISPFWLNFILPTFLKKYNINLFFSPNHFLPIRNIGTIDIIAIHGIGQKVNKDYHSLLYRKYADLLLSIAIKKSKLVIAVSESCKRDIVKFFNTPPEKIKVVYGAADEIFRPINLSNLEKQKIKKKYNLPDKFILYVGVLEKVKNIEGVIKIADLLKDKTRIPILLFGKIGHHGRNYLREIKKRKNIQYKGFIESKDLSYIYNLATIFLFPSFYEGFGFPVLEAMQSGLPVVASNTSSLPEVIGEAGIMHNPRDYEGFAKDILRLLEDKDFYDKMRKQGIERAKKFNWEKTTKEIVTLFNQVYET